MTEDEKLRAMFDTILAANWLSKERYGAGLVELLKEANSPSELKTIRFVLEKLNYCNSEDLVGGGHEAAQQIESGWGMIPDDTLIVGVATGPKTCGSTAYLRTIETELSSSWSRSQSIWTTFDSAFRKRKNHKNLVLVDDFIGTGSKLLKLIGRLRDNPNTKDYRIHVCCFGAMESGANLVSSLVNGELLAHRQYVRCISDTTNDPIRSQLLQDMGSLETNIFSNPNGEYSLGYKQSEASFYLEGFNIPNNNFPILWWEKYATNAPRRTLFSRR